MDLMPMCQIARDLRVKYVKTGNEAIHREFIRHVANCPDDYLALNEMIAYI